MFINSGENELTSTSAKATLSKIMSLMKQQFAVTPQYSFTGDRKSWTYPQPTNTQANYISTKI